MQTRVQGDSSTTAGLALGPVVGAYFGSNAANVAVLPRTVEGSGGYSYEHYPDGTLVIQSGPGITKPVRLVQGAAWEAITHEIGVFPSVSDGRAQDNVPVAAHSVSEAGGGLDVSDGRAQDNVPVAAHSVPEAGGWLDWLVRQMGDFEEGIAEVQEDLGDALDALWLDDTIPAAAPAVGENAVGENAHDVQEEEAFSGTGTPLEIALGKVGKVTYKDPNHGENRDNFTSDELAKLQGGDDKMAVASCSPFAYWTLVAWDPEIKEQAWSKTVQKVINLSGVSDYAGKVEEGHRDIRGAATAFTDAGIGSEVKTDEAAPGDYVQSFRGLGGHSTIVHRAYMKGSAIFGLPHSPDLLEKGDLQQGTPTPLGFDGSEVSFRVDENTDAKLVGEFRTEEVELLGAHTGGKDSDGKKQGGGVFTKQKAKLEVKEKEKDQKAYVGRLSKSIWAQHQPVDPHAFAEDTAEDTAEERSESEKAPAASVGSWLWGK